MKAIVSLFVKRDNQKCLGQRVIELGNDDHSPSVLPTIYGEEVLSAIGEVWDNVKHRSFADNKQWWDCVDVQVRHNPDEIEMDGLEHSDMCSRTNIFEPEKRKRKSAKA